MVSAENLLVWGKSSSNLRGDHRCLAHLQDHLMAVVAVTRALLELPRFAHVARRLLHPVSSSKGAERQTGPLTEPEMWPFLWAAAVHDLGKLTFPFQAKQAQLWAPLAGLVPANSDLVDLDPKHQEADLQILAEAWRTWDQAFASQGLMPRNSYLHNLRLHAGRFAHGDIGDRVPWILDDRLRKITTPEENAPEMPWLWRHLARAAFAHHGSRLSDADLQAERALSLPRNELVWGPAASALARFWLPRMEALITLDSASPRWNGWSHSNPLPEYEVPVGLPALSHWVAGLVTVADWLGSGLAHPGEADVLVACPAASFDEPMWRFASIQTQHTRWLNASGQETSAREEARAVLKAQWDSLLASARIRVRQLFEAELALASHHPELPVPTGLWFDVDPRLPKALSQWRAKLRPLQERMLDLDVPMGPDAPPRLVLLEAPMGEGKTEAAEILVNRLIQSGAASGAIFALPTEASTTRLRDRVGDYAAALLNFGGVEISSQEAAQQASGQAAWLRRQAKAAPDFSQSEKAGDRSRQAAYRFFTSHNRRSFLAPFTVCTVDQLEMAVMPTRHAQVRALGLAGRVLVIDEAHAYDAYMRHILIETIRMVGRMGGWTIVLSATLPQTIRQQMLAAYAKPNQEGVETGSGDQPHAQAYPLLSHIALGDALSQAQMKEIAPSARQLAQETWMHVEWQYQKEGLWRERFPEAWAAISGVLVGESRGCAVILCNTVARAQSVYDEVVAWAAEQASPVVVDLLHSRFRRHERQMKEELLLEWAGKGSVDHPEKRAGYILIATQVVEQSLDFDFDAMASDAAPIDLELQRGGRLHRHRRPYRPTSARRAVCYIVIEHPRPTVPLTLAGYERLVSDPGSMLRGQLAPYVRELKHGTQSTIDAEIMARTLMWMNEQSGPEFKLPSLREAVDAVYRQLTVTDQVLHQAAYEHRISMDPPHPLEGWKGLDPAWKTTGVPAVQASSVTRLSDEDTLSILILEQGKDSKWRPPIMEGLASPARSSRLEKGFDDLLAHSGEPGLDMELLDHLQSWVVPIPEKRFLGDIMRKHEGLDPDLFKQLTGKNLDEKNRYLLPFQVVRGYRQGNRWVLGTKGGPLSSSSKVIFYSSNRGLEMVSKS